MPLLALALAAPTLLVVWTVLQTIAASVLVALWPGGPDVLVAGILLAVLPPGVGGLLAMTLGAAVAGRSRMKPVFIGLAAVTGIVVIAGAADWLARPELADPARAVSAIVEGCAAVVGLALGHCAETGGRGAASGA